MARTKAFKNLAASFLQAQCDAWNSSNPVGTRVVLTRDDGSTEFTFTKSEAALLSGHTPVIWLQGVSGAYLLDRIKAAPLE